MTAEIDPTTGLPTLPTNHFWKVQHARLIISVSLPAGEWSEWEETTISGYASWGGRKRWDTQIRQHEGPRKFPLFKRTTITETRDRRAAAVEQLFAVRYEDGEAIEHSTWWDNPGDYHLEPGDKMTRDNLLERAVDVHARWQASIDRASILGNYPPNKLEAR